MTIPLVNKPILTMLNDQPFGSANLLFDGNSIKIQNSVVATISAGIAVGFGTAAPNSNSILDLTSTKGALLVPRMTTTQKNALTAVNGMIVYDSTLNKFQGYENGAWASFI